MLNNRPENSADLRPTSTDIASRLALFRQQEQTQLWSGTFAQYFDLVTENPSVARLSHGRVYDMITSKGVEGGQDGKGSQRYNFFEGEIFGLEKPIAQLAEYFASSAAGLETRKRILMLMGPVGGGKSSIVTLLKRGLEAYSRTDQGAAYTIEGCPMNEEPLHLIPDAMRSAVLEDYGLHIEGELCPHCRQTLVDQYAGNAEDVRVTRVTFSEQERRGIGTFTPSDPKSQDISELTGSIDLSTIGDYGSESDPRAYRFDGELNIANRGVMEFVEMLKCDEKFLYGLLTLSQEQSIKTGRFAMIYADEVIISHTNEAEYQAFVGSKKTEALQDRMIIVRVPYNLRVSGEVKIYEKLLREGHVSGVHVAPNTLQAAATFAILSRLEPSKKAGMSAMKKLKLYDGQAVEGADLKDIRDLQEESPREGMDGISPRFIINRLSAAIVKEGRQCINPIDAIRALKEGIELNNSLDPKKREELLTWITETRKGYDDAAKTEVQKAFVYSFPESASTLLQNYLDNVEAFCNRNKLTDPITGEEVEPDEKLMRSIEEQIGVIDNAKKSFRDEILIRLAALSRKGKTFEYTSHERLREAIEKKLFADMKDVVKITTSTKTPDAEQLRRINGVADRLVAHGGYCAHCANELLKYVGTLLNR